MVEQDSKVLLIVLKEDKVLLDIEDHKALKAIKVTNQQDIEDHKVDKEVKVPLTM
jgi:hypothetical protein